MEKTKEKINEKKIGKLKKKCNFEKKIILKKKEKKRKKGKVGKKKKRKTMWITVVIHSVLYMGKQ